MRGTAAATVFLVLLGSACASGLSVEEYATAIEGHVVVMNDRLAEGDPLYGRTPTADELSWFFNDRVAARRTFVEELTRLEPPETARELHDTALRVLERLVDVEGELAAFVETSGPFESLEAVWQTPQGQAALAVDQEAVALCESAQSQFDSTKARADLSELPWIPPELKEVVLVTFRCTG